MCRRFPLGTVCEHNKLNACTRNITNASTHHNARGYNDAQNSSSVPSYTAWKSEFVGVVF